MHKPSKQTINKVKEALKQIKKNVRRDPNTINSKRN